MMLRKVTLYYHTLSKLKKWQIFGRILAGVKRKYVPAKLPAPLEAAVKPLEPVTAFPRHDPWNTEEKISDGVFTFLNQSEQLGRPINWNPSHLPLLWQFNLHYFHFLNLLNPAQQSELCTSWIQANPPAKGVGWHPYPTALRIVNWCKAGPQDLATQASLYQQTAHLFRNLETYIYGNHLLENAKALVLAGCFFKGQGESTRWLKKGLQIFKQETPEQILPDGGHYERSPMYHSLMLEAYLDVLNCLPENHPDHAFFSNTVNRMTDVLYSLLHPDGSLPLFNDATHEIAHSPQALLAYAEVLTRHTPQKKPAFPESGYFVHSDDHLFLIIDGGVIGPDYLLAHAHADIFSFEMSLEGTPFIVDSGVYEYQAGEMRDYVRSTAAHNTVTVDGISQVECWGSFRVARRTAPHDVRFSKNANSSSFEGSFSGYSKLIGDNIQHHRSMNIDGVERQILVEDRVTGTGNHVIESRIHFHPGVTVTKEEENRISFKREKAVCHLEVIDGEMRWEDGWYCPRFGIKEKNKVLVIGEKGALPARLSYRISY